MERDEFHRLADLFERACNLPEALRREFLDQACLEQPELRGQVESLLARDGEGDLEAFCAANPRIVTRLHDLHESWHETLAIRDSSMDTERVLARLARRAAGAPRYDVKGEIARGGMGAVLEVWDDDVRRMLAMKVILGDDARATDPTHVARFLEEAQVTGQLDHPGVVPVHDIGLDENGRVFFTMKRVRGKDLREIYDQVKYGEEDWTVARALSALLRVCEAMAFAHSRGVIHRDLKPANVMVGSFGEVYVMDWGLARVLGREDDRESEAPGEPMALVRTDRDDERERTPDTPFLTEAGAVLGTPAYMPPEQAQGKVDQLDSRSDVYAVGAMLYQLLAGRMPYVPEDARIDGHTILRWVLDGPPERLRNLNRKVPAELEAICEKAMARNPDHRYPDMTGMAEDLRAYLEQRVVKAYASGPIAELRKWVARNRGITATAVVALVVLGAFGSWSLSRIGAEQRQAAAATKGKLEMQDIRRARELLAEENDTLWPVGPELVERCDLWLEACQELQTRAPIHQATLDNLRDARAAATTEPMAQESLLEEELTAHLESLPSLNDRAARVRERRDRSATLVERSIGQHREDWDRCVAAIRDSPVYGGIVIVPQLGLVPIGENAQGMWEFWLVESGNRPVFDQAAERWAPHDDSGLILILVPGETYLIGATDQEGPNYDETALPHCRPAKEISLDPFFLSKYEFTQGQWVRLFEGHNPSVLRPGEPRPDGYEPDDLSHPVETVGWQECMAACTRLSLVLPTEAQWEAACRAGTDTVWSFATIEERRQAYLYGNFAGEESVGSWKETSGAFGADDFVWHAPVGRFAPNPWGFFDVHGNLWEWCADAYSSVAYQTPANPGDGLREVSGANHRYRPGRGGCCTQNAIYGTSAFRIRIQVQDAQFDVGFRPARPLNREKVW